MRVRLSSTERCPDHAMTADVAEAPAAGPVLELRPSEWIAYQMAVKEYERWQERLGDPSWLAVRQVQESSQ